MSKIKEVYLSQPTKTGSMSVLEVTKSLGAFKNHIVLDDKIVNKLKSSKNTLSIVTVRNPYDRCLSMYNFFTMFKETSFDYFLEYIKKHIDHKFFCHQHKFYQYGAFKVDEIMKIESMEDDWKRVINGKLSIDLDMIHNNKDPRSRKMTLTKEEKQFIYELYEEDFKKFNYKK